MHRVSGVCCLLSRLILAVAVKVSGWVVTIQYSSVRRDLISTDGSRFDAFPRFSAVNCCLLRIFTSLGFV